MSDTSTPSGITGNGVRYRLTDFQLHYNVAKEPDRIYAAGFIYDDVRAPGEQERFERWINREILAGFRQDAEGLRADALSWLKAQLDDQHYTWITQTLPSRVPPPDIFTPAEIATFVLGVEGEDPMCQLESTHLDRGTKPEGIKKGDPGRPEPRRDPFKKLARGEHREGLPVAPAPVPGPTSTAATPPSTANTDAAPPVKDGARGSKAK